MPHHDGFWWYLREEAGRLQCMAHHDMSPGTAIQTHEHVPWVREQSCRRVAGTCGAGVCMCAQEWHTDWLATLLRQV